MKRYITFIGLLVCVVTSAQNINDVLRYSAENLQGTARFQGMGGAFGALGGDLSALNINPAGSAVFNNSLFTVSGTSYTHDNSTRYFNDRNETVTNDLDINQVGGVFVLKSTNTGSPWKKVSLAINYDIVNNFNDDFFISGNSNQGIDNYFLDFADGVRLGPLKVQDGEYIEDAYLDIGKKLGHRQQQAFLGFQAGIIEPDPDNDDTTTYRRNSIYNTVDQRFSKNTTGYNSKLTFNVASQYMDFLYLGLSLNFHTVLYNKLTKFDETGYDATSPIKSTSFDNLLHTSGSGFSFNLGAIAKINDIVRIGGSYQSSTWYRLTDELSQRVNSDFSGKNEDIHFINFDLVNIFDDYTIKTPAKLTGSLAIVFGKEGLLSFDYGYQDMSQAELRPTSNADLADENIYISKTLGTVSSYRVGGEYRIKRLSLRGGYRFEQSPYVDGTTIGDLNGFSAGIGYSFGGNRIDLAFNRTEQDVNEWLFNTGLTTPAIINNVSTNLTLGYTLNF